MLQRITLCLLLWTSGAPAAPPHAARTRNLLVVMVDGVRWQEVFSGAEAALMDRKTGGVADPDALRAQFWREDPAERRRALMPFLWNVVARQGQIFGNRTLAAEVYLTNGFNFSYPSYSETLCGVADPRVDSNDKKPNPNVNVLEWLNRQEGLKGRVAAFAAWDRFPYILNAERAGMLVNAGYEPLTVAPQTPALRLLNRLKAETEVWSGEPLDALTFHTALEYLRLHKPRVLFLGLGEPDEWAHSGRYDLYLKSVLRADQYIRELWETMQRAPGYRGRTTLVLATDHGRGSTLETWRDHGRRVPDSRYTWVAFLGPDTEALGERRQREAIQQAQVAATIAALLGLDFRNVASGAAPPVPDVLPK